MKQRRTVLMTGIALMGFLFLFSVVERAQAAEPIRIGSIFSITGWAGAMGTPPKEAIEIVVDDVNRKGGVLGRPIEIVYEDDQSNPTNSAVAATKVIRDRKVSALLGSTLTVFCMPIIPIVEREQVPMMAFGAGHEITNPFKKWVFRIPMTDYRLSPRMLDFAVNTLGARKLALLHSTDASGMMGAQGVVETVGKHGASLVITEKFEPQDTSMIPQLTKVKAAQPDAIILYTNAAPAAVIAKNYQQLGMKTPVIASHGVPTAEFVKLAGKIVEGGRWIIFGPKCLFADKMDPNDPWRKNIFDPFQKALKEKTGKTEVTGWYANGYDAINMVIQAIKIAGKDDRAAIRDALEKVKYNGLLADFAYSPTDHDGQSPESLMPTIIKEDSYWPYKK